MTRDVLKEGVEADEKGGASNVAVPSRSIGPVRGGVALAADADAFGCPVGVCDQGVDARANRCEFCFAEDGFDGEESAAVEG